MLVSQRFLYKPMHRRALRKHYLFIGNQLSIIRILANEPYRFYGAFEQLRIDTFMSRYRSPLALRTNAVSSLCREFCSVCISRCSSHQEHIIWCQHLGEETPGFCGADEAVVRFIDDNTDAVALCSCRPYQVINRPACITILSS